MENIELKTKYVKHLFPEEKGQPTSVRPLKHGPIRYMGQDLYERRYGEFEYEQLPGGYERSKNAVHTELTDANGKIVAEYFLRSNSNGEGKSGYVVEYWDGDRDKPSTVFQASYSETSDEELHSTKIHINQDGQATLETDLYLGDFELDVEKLKDKLSFIEEEQVKKFVAEVLSKHDVDVSTYSFSYNKGNVRPYAASGEFNIEVNLDRKELNLYKLGENYPSFMYSDGKVFNYLFPKEEKGIEEAKEIFKSAPIINEVFNSVKDNATAVSKEMDRIKDALDSYEKLPDSSAVRNNPAMAAYLKTEPNPDFSKTLDNVKEHQKKEGVTVSPKHIGQQKQQNVHKPNGKGGR